MFTYKSQVLEPTRSRMTHHYARCRYVEGKSSVLFGDCQRIHTLSKTGKERQRVSGRMSRDTRLERETVKTNARQEKQVRGVKHVFRNGHRTRQEQHQHTGKQEHLTNNPEAWNRARKQTDIGKEITQVIESP